MFRLFIAVVPFMILTHGTKEIAEAIFKGSAFLPLNDGDNAFNHLMGQDLNRLREDIDAILALDPTYQVIPQNERNIANDQKQTLVRLLVKFHLIITNHMRTHQLNDELTPVEEDLEAIDAFLSPDLADAEEIEAPGRRQYQPFPDLDANFDEITDENQEMLRSQEIFNSNPTSEFPRNDEDEARRVIRIGFDVYCANDVVFAQLYKLLMELSGETSMISSSSLYKYQTIEAWFRTQMGATLLSVYPLIEMLSTFMSISFVNYIIINFNCMM